MHLTQQTHFTGWSIKSPFRPCGSCGLIVSSSLTTFPLISSAHAQTSTPPPPAESSTLYLTLDINKLSIIHYTFVLLSVLFDEGHLQRVSHMMFYFVLQSNVRWLEKATEIQILNPTSMHSCMKSFLFRPLLRVCHSMLAGCFDSLPNRGGFNVKNSGLQQSSSHTTSSYS